MMDDIDKHLDAVLRAVGSGLRNYTMQKSLDDMRAAMRAAMAAAKAPAAQAVDTRALAANLRILADLLGIFHGGDDDYVASHSVSTLDQVVREVKALRSLVDDVAASPASTPDASQQAAPETGLYKLSPSFPHNWGVPGPAILTQLTEQAATVEGRMVSVAVDTGNEDADEGKRIFARLTGETASDGVTLIADEVSRNFSAGAATTSENAPSAMQEKLRALADRIDYEKLWRRPMMYRDQLTDEQRDRLDAGVMLRRYSDMLAPGRWLVLPPTGNVRYSAGSLDVVCEIAKRDEARKGNKC